MDPEQKNVICVTKGKDSGTWAECNTSPAFIKGATEHFPNAFITFDKFHVIQSAIEAIDEVRRKERKSTHGPERLDPMGAASRLEPMMEVVKMLQNWQVN
jgi:transposase